MVLLLPERLRERGNFITVNLWLAFDAKLSLFDFFLKQKSRWRLLSALTIRAHFLLPGSSQALQGGIKGNN